MTNKIIVSKFISFIALFTILLLAVCNVYAEYYVVYSVVELGAPISSCSTPCQRVVTHKYKKYVKYKKHSRYNIQTYYVWPMYAGTLWVPKCGGGCMQWSSGYCRTMDCQDFYVPPQYIRSYYDPDDLGPPMDMRTADDF